MDIHIPGKESKRNMKDTYGRIINYMRISVTDRCNLRCRYCMPEGVELVPVADILTFEEILRICDAAAELGISRLKVTGGEPLVRLGCPELIGKLKRIPGVEQVTLTTNGVLLSQYMKELTDNGLDAVNISLDTLQEKTYQEITGRNCLQEVLHGVELAVRSGIPVKLNCVLQNGVNAHEWKNMAELTKAGPIDVRFIEMMPIGYGRRYEPVNNEEVLRQMRDAYPLLERDETYHGNGPAVYYRIPGARGSVGLISAMHGKFCAYCNRLRLTSKGKLKPCLCYEDCLDLAGILRQTGQEAAAQKRQIQDAIRKAVAMKPACHRFEEPDGVTEQKRMAEIGG